MNRISPNRLATRNADLQKDQPAGPRLRELEAVIRRAQKSYVEAGNALHEIQRDRLYRDRGFRSFDEYVREHWQMGRARAYQMIEAAKTVEEVSTVVDTLPTSERHVRELARADEPAEVWAEVVEQHAPEEITAAVIREHVEARRPAPQLSAVAPPPPSVRPLLVAVAEAVAAARRGGASSQEIHGAYLQGITP